jgi:hypothetical protein
MTVSEQELDDALDEAKDKAEQLGDEVGEEIEGETGTGDVAKGFRSNHGTHTYIVAGATAWEHIVVRYPFNLDNAIAIRKATGGTPGNQQTTEITEQDIKSAQVDLDEKLSNQNDADLREFRLNLLQILCREGCALDLNTTKPHYVHGFDLDKKIFIYEDGMTISEYENAVQTIVNLGLAGKEYLLENYGLREGGDTQSTTGTPSKGFQ